MNEDLKTFYTLVRRTRAGVLDWLGDLPPDVFAREHQSFAFGSLSAIYAHVADCYLWWVGAVGFGAEDRDVKLSDVYSLRAAFAEVDETILKALETFTKLDDPFTWTSPTGVTETLTRRWLLLHPMTHEFHHKGQALALARVLGHPHPGAPDTDLVPPSGEQS